MKASGNTVLITGGALGIGLALAEEFASNNNRVIICDVLKVSLISAKKRIKDLRIEVCDVTDELAVKALAKKLEEEEGGINILINNAAIGKYHNFSDGSFSTNDVMDEINVNFLAPIRMVTHFLSQLKNNKGSAIINISAGLAYIPYHRSPIYSASKAALHSYSLTLRYQLRDTGIKVFEVFPPRTNTRLSTDQTYVMAPEDLARAVFQEFKKDRFEIRVGPIKTIYFLSRFLPNYGFKFINALMDKRPKK